VTGSEREGAPARPPLLSSGLATYATYITAATLSLGSVLVTARTLGPAGRGQVAFLTTVGFLTAQVATMGVEQAVVNFSARRPELTRTLLVNSVLLAALLGATAAGLVAGLVAVFPPAAAHTAIPLLALVLAAVPVLVLQVYLQQLAVAHYRFGASNASWLVPALVNFCVNCALAALGLLSVGSAVATWVGGQALGALIVWRAAASGPWRAHPDATLARAMLGFGVKAHAGRVLLLGNYRLDQWIIGAVSGPAQLGYYSVAVAWAEGIFYLPTALAMAQRPDLVRAAPATAAHDAARAVRVVLVITLGLALAMVVLAPALCVGVFGESFRPSIGQLRILSGGALGIAALKLLGNALTAQRMPLRETAAIAVAFVATITLDALLIPARAGTGAAIASTVGYLAGGVAVALIFVRSFPARLAALMPGVGDLREVTRQASVLARRLGRAG
jgi:O-antigen/teichoic acid export membrane protein